MFGTINADIMNGLDGNDILNSREGRDIITGGFGSDTIDAGAGTDTLVFSEDPANRVDTDAWNGGAGTDTADFSGFHSAVLINFTANHEGFTRDTTNLLSGTWRIITEITNVENIIGSAFDDSLVGDAASNELHGGDGNDIIYGGIGDDNLFGEAGNDWLFGNQNTDSIDGGAGDDRLFVDGLDTSVIGGDGYDRLNVQASLGANVNLATAGIERAEGNSGDDIFDATGKSDFSVFIKGFAGHDILTGSLLGDRVFGGDGNDIISGSDGNDRIYGQAGADQLFGGDGDDRLFGDSDDTVLDGGDGDDRLIVQSGDGITYDAATGNVEKVFGSNSTTIGDVLTAAGAVDTVVFYGRGGNDMLTGGSATDVLRGGDGNDVLNGGAGGNDRLFGDSGADIFEFNPDWGRDKIEGGFSDGSDMVRFSGVLDNGGGSLDFADLTIIYDGGDAVISTTGNINNTITILGFDHTLLDATDFYFV